MRGCYDGSNKVGMLSFNPELNQQPPLKDPVHQLIPDLSQYYFIPNRCVGIHVLWILTLHFMFGKNNEEKVCYIMYITSILAIFRTVLLPFNINPAPLPKCHKATEVPPEYLDEGIFCNDLLCSGHTMLYTACLIFIFQLDISSMSIFYIVNTITVLLYVP
eukprot:UN15673